MCPLGLLFLTRTPAPAQLLLEQAKGLLDVAVATHKSIPLVVQTRVYKLKRNLKHSADGFDPGVLLRKKEVWRRTMKRLSIRHQYSVADPLQQERIRRALAIILEQQEEVYASRPLRSRLHPQSTTGRHDHQSAASATPLYPSTGMESVIDA